MDAFVLWRHNKYFPPVWLCLCLFFQEWNLKIGGKTFGDLEPLQTDVQVFIPPPMRIDCTYRLFIPFSTVCSIWLRLYLLINTVMQSSIRFHNEHQACPTLFVSLLPQKHFRSFLYPIIQHFSLHRNCLTMRRSWPILHFLRHIEKLIPHLADDRS